MENLDDWWRKSVLRQFGKECRSKVNLSSIVENILNGKDIESQQWILILPEDWESQFKDFIDTARSQGDTKRQEELEALHSFFGFQSDLQGKRVKDVLTQAEKIRELSGKLVSPAVQAFLLGSLGVTLSSYGLMQVSSQLTEEAVDAARRGDLTWAELQWSINLALFRMNDAPRETDRELRHLLLVARNIGDQKRIGMILNNLAFVNEGFFSNLAGAIRYQEEAVAVARRIGDKASELKRIFHLAHMQEQMGQTELAIKNYDQGLTLDTEIGMSDVGFRVFKHVSELIAGQYRDKTKEILSTHMQSNRTPHSQEDIRALMERSETGHVMSSWDPSQGRRCFIPDNSFANELSVRGEWEALTVYAYQWMEQGFVMGDNRGFHWLSVALRSLGYVGAADEALQIAVELPKAFDKHINSEDRR